MLQRPFRFLHAGNLHLDSPCQTASDLPDHLIDLVIDAPLQAATKIFDAALDKRVDFLLLAGDVIDPYCAAPHELLFLVQQFQRLADRNIPIYWSGGSIDSVSQWPSYIAWPNNVHRFAAGHVRRHRHEIAGIRSAKSSAAARILYSRFGPTIFPPAAPISFPLPWPTPIGTPVPSAKSASTIGR